VEGFAVGVGVELLRIVRAAGNDDVRVVAGVNRHLTDSTQVGNLFAEPEGEINPRLGLVLGGMFLGVGIEAGPARLTGRGQRLFIGTLRAPKPPRDDAVLAFVNRRGTLFSAHGAVHGFNGELGGMRWGVGLPTGNLSFARLARGKADVHGLLYGLI